MESQPLRAMIASARTGRDEGYRQLMAAFGPRLYGYFYRATASHHDAEDLLGEVMLRLVRRLDDYDDRGRFEPWLFSIAANLVRDRIRRTRTRGPAVSLDAEAADKQSLAETLGGRDKPVDAGLSGAEDSSALAAALAELDEQTRQMVLLRHFAQMSFKEIAEIFSCPLGTVLARVHRALKVLRKALEAGPAADDVEEKP
jgi:RNA polymerase sigma-70 factor (ECF subfamily)